MTNFPYGVSSYGIPLIGSGPIITTGKVLFVHSGTGIDARGRGTSPSAPLDSLDYAVGLCRANKNDTIICMPGHAETLTGAGGVTADKAGISIIGLGMGSNRPTFTFGTATGASFLISAANVMVQNILFIGTKDILTNPIHVTAADVRLLNIETRDTTGSAQATDFILTTAAANRLLIDGWIHRGDVAAGADAALAIVGGDGITVRNFDVIGNFAVGAIDVRTTLTTQLRVSNGMFRTYNSADIAIIDTITASTGFIGPDILVMVKDHAANITEAFTGATFVYHPNIYICNLAGESAMPTNITASTHA